jgi:hypothetical protein
LYLVSSGTGTPSFGDLFDDPDDTASAVAEPSEKAVPRPVTAPAAAPAAPTPVEPATPEPVVVADRVGVAEPVAVEPSPARGVTVAALGDDADPGYRSEHDLDHESSEASHLVAGFEPADEPEPASRDDARPAAVAVASAVGAGAAREAWDGVPDPAVAATPAARVDTGRLYRSSGAEGPATLDAIPAIDPSRTPMAASPAAAPAKPVKPRSTPRTGAGLTYSGVVVIVTGVTVVVAFLEALLRHQIGWLTGLALLVSSIYCAVVVRRPDIWAAVVVPPIAFLVASLTAGQLTLDQNGSLLIREGYGLFRNLAVNAPWILGTTAVCLVIVLVRRKREAAIR